MIIATEKIQDTKAISAPQMIGVKERRRVRTINVEESKAQQHFLPETDVNNIMKKYKKIGIDYNKLPQLMTGEFKDLSNIPDYHTAMNTVLDSNRAFMALPAEMRSRFENDPAQLLKFIGDEKNHDEGVKLGLFKPKQQQQQQKQEPKNDNSNDENKAPKTKKTTTTVIEHE